MKYQDYPNPTDHPPDPDGVELALRFLEADPRSPGADAAKQQIAQTLRHATFTAEQRDRVAALVLRALRHGGEPVFRAYAQLAPRVTSPLFEAAVTCYAASCETPVFDRAEYVLHVLRPARGHGTAPNRRARANRFECAGSL